MKESVYDRLMGLAVHQRRATYLALAVAYEQRSPGYPTVPCECGRGQRASNWCLQCWQEMYDLSIKIGS